MNLLNVENSQKITMKSLSITEINLAKIYMIPRRVIIESSLPNFQYSTLDNCVYLNNRLSRLDKTIPFHYAQ